MHSKLRSPAQFEPPLNKTQSGHTDSETNNSPFKNLNPHGRSECSDCGALAIQEWTRLVLNVFMSESFPAESIETGSQSTTAGWGYQPNPPLQCNRTRARPGPEHNHIIWLYCGPEILGPQHDVGKYYGRALVLRHRAFGHLHRTRGTICGSLGAFDFDIQVGVLDSENQISTRKFSVSGSQERWV